MKLYLLRHAEAADTRPDAERQLTPKGVDTTRALARFLNQRKTFQPGEIRHSPLVRACQTAAIFAEHLDQDVSVVEAPLLLPEDDPAGMARLVNDLAVEQERPDIVLTGHNPHLTCLASLLLAGPDGPVVVVFKKTAMLCLDYAGAGRWLLEWMLPPKLYR